MHILTIILTIAVGLVVLALILAAVGPKEYNVSKSIDIQRPVDVVFDYVRHIKNQDKYNKWTMVDPEMKRTFTGTDGQPGFIYAWDGNKQAGAGEQEIKGIREGEEVDIEVRFIRPFAGVAKTPITTTPIDAGATRVTWNMHSRMPYPMNVILLFMNMDKALGKELQASLKLLKDNLEK